MLKIFKGTFIFPLSVVWFIVSCGSQEDLPNTPTITFESVLIKEADLIETDSLIINVNYEDGDGDLGLDPNDSTSRPFHPFDFIFRENALVVRYRDVVSEPSFQTFIPNLITARLEPFVSSNQAPPLTIQNGNFEFQNTNGWLFGPGNIDSLIVLEDGSSIEREQIFGEGEITIGDLITDGFTSLEVVDVLTDQDTAWIQRNENFFNFFVDIYFQNSQGQFEELDLLAITGTNFDGRFPVLVPSGEATPIIGTIKLGLATSGFRVNPTLRNETLLLSIKIQDRSLNRSDSVVSNPFRYRDFINF